MEYHEALSYLAGALARTYPDGEYPWRHTQIMQALRTIMDEAVKDAVLQAMAQHGVTHTATGERWHT